MSINPTQNKVFFKKEILQEKYDAIIEFINKKINPDTTQISQTGRKDSYVSSIDFSKDLEPQLDQLLFSKDYLSQKQKIKLENNTLTLKQKNARTSKVL